MPTASIPDFNQGTALHFVYRNNQLKYKGFFQRWAQKRLTGTK
jgi:hypothetical protein